MKLSKPLSALIGSLLISSTAIAATNTPSLEEMWNLIQQQQQEIQTLKASLNQTRNEVEASADIIDEISTVSPTTVSKTQVGGYGELHYNSLTNQAVGGGDNKNTVDLHRFVMFLNHQFNDKIRFFSELEVEHAMIEGATGGAVEMEQAFLEFDISPETRIRAGMQLIPVGIINETHEPNTFYGTERNPIEKNIIPTTWREAGAMLKGRWGAGWSYDLAYTSGLDLSAANTVRSGRTNVSNAPAKSGLFSGRIKWAGWKGVELASTLMYQDDYNQGQLASKGQARLWETHAVVQRGPYSLRALYADWNLSDKTSGYDRQTGWYIEPSYKINSQWGLFTRYNRWDNQAGDSTDSVYKQLDIGANYWPHKDVVVKIDYQNQKTPTGKDEYDGVNVGLGYQF
ncbi:MAG: porin [Gammaproteobacteria bacterium]|nr:porin [Gammaproteobacteria bacterium]